MRKLFLAALCCAEFSWAQAWDPNRPLIYRMWLAFETQNWVNMYSTATVLSKSDNTEAFRVVANSTTTPVYQLLVTTQGYVGISTGSPQAKFHVSGGDSRFGDGSSIIISSSGYMTFANLASSPTASAGRVYYDSGSNKLRLSTGAAWADIITSGSSTTAFSGAVSVGTTSSSAVLTVYSGSGADAVNISVVTSSGANWTQATSAASWTARSFTTPLLFNNKMWICGGGSGSVFKNDVWYSSDGVNWNSATLAAAWSARTGHTALVFGGKMWLMGGYDTGFKNDVWYSSDGINWTQATSSAGWTPRDVVVSAVFNDKMWILGGEPSTNDVWYSSDGTNWTQATSSAAWPARKYHSALVFGGRMWILGGLVSGNQNDVWYSPDGVNWTQATSAAGWSARYAHTSLVFNNKMWVLGSRAYQNDVWYSSDGANWTQATSAAAWAGRYGLSSLVFNNKIWILGGYDGVQDRNDVWSSDFSTSTASPALAVTSAGNVGIGTTVADNTLTVNGTAWVTGGSWSGSDERWKKNVAPIPDALDKVMKLRGVSFDWRRDEFPAMKFSPGGQIGFIAQEVKKVFPEVVSSDGSGYLGISYEKLVPVMAEAIKELERRYETTTHVQETEIEKLKAANAKLEAANEQLEKRFSALEGKR